MKAVVVTKPFELEIQEVEKPVITDSKDVIVKVTSGGICGSDVGIFNGTNKLATYPRIIGHEFAGFVEKVGSEVTKVKAGDLVAVDPVSYCGHCYACRVGRTNVCSEVEVAGIHRDGGFAEYNKATEDSVYKLDSDIVSPEDASMVEPYSIGYEANERGEVAEGDKVLVMGAGPIGIAAMQVAKARGAKVMITDILDKRIERAVDMGADRGVNVTKEDLKEAISEFTDGEGMPVVIDAICSATSIVEALDHASAAGRVVSLGLNSVPSEIPSIAIGKKGLTIYGSRLNNRRFPEVIELFENEKVSAKKMKTHTFDYKATAEALEFMKNNQDEICKVVLTFID